MNCIKFYLFQFFRSYQIFLHCFLHTQCTFYKISYYNKNQLTPLLFYFSSFVYKLLILNFRIIKLIKKVYYISNYYILRDDSVNILKSLQSLDLINKLTPNKQREITHSTTKLNISPMQILLVQLAYSKVKQQVG